MHVRLTAAAVEKVDLDSFMEILMKKTQWHCAFQCGSEGSDVSVSTKVSKRNMLHPRQPIIGELLRAWNIHFRFLNNQLTRAHVNLLIMPTHQNVMEKL